MQAKVISWPLFLWHDFDCCVGKLTVPSSWISWRLSLRWASCKIQCEWTMVHEHRFLKAISIFRPTNISLFQKGSICRGVWTWLRSKSKRGEKFSKCCDLGPNVKRRFSFNQTLIKCLFKVPEQAHKMEKAGIWQSPCCIKTSGHEFPSFCRSTRGGNLTSHYFGRFWILHTHRPKTNYPY